MTIVLGTSDVQTFTNYDGLKAALVDFLDGRGQDRIAEFIAYAEDYLRANLDVTDNEAIMTGAGPSFLVPNARRIVAVTPVNGCPLRRVSLDELHSNYQQGSQPKVYAQWADSVIIGPAPDDDARFRVHYVEDFRRLSSDNQGNWLILKNPALYLYASLVHAEACLRDPSWIDRFWEYVNATISGMNRQAQQKRNAGVLRPNLGIVP